MQQDVRALACDEPGCESQVQDRSALLVEAARRAGWQVREVVSIAVEDEGLYGEMTDRCPDHHVAVIPREQVLDEFGGIGGVQDWMLP